MKCSINRERFTQAVTRVEKITGKNLSLQILKNILIIADKNKITLRSTNLDIGIEVSISCKVEKKGIVAIPGDVIYAFLTNSNTIDTIELENIGGTLKVKAGKSSASIKTVPHEDFPNLPKVEDGTKLELESDVLVKGFKSVWYSASSSSMKPELSSVYIGYSNNTLIFAATDSFRLAEKAVVAKNITSFDPFLVPLKNVSEIIRNLEEVGGIVTIIFNENQISCFLGDTYLTSRLIDGTFPDYNQIIPKKNDTEVIVLKQELTQQLKIANIFSNKFNQIGFSINPNKKSFIITTHNSDVGESITNLDSTITGEELDISFNYKYITDGFQSISTDSLVMQFSGIGKPLVLKGVGDPSFTYLVMPMNK